MRPDDPWARSLLSPSPSLSGSADDPDESPADYDLLVSTSRGDGLMNELDLSRRDDRAIVKTTPFTLAKLRQKKSAASGEPPGSRVARSGGNVAVANAAVDPSSTHTNPAKKSQGGTDASRRKAASVWTNAQGEPVPHCPPSKVKPTKAPDAPVSVMKASNKGADANGDRTGRGYGVKGAKAPRGKNKDAEKIEFHRLPANSSSNSDFPIVAGFDRQRALPPKSKSIPHRSLPLTQKAPARPLDIDALVGRKTRINPRQTGVSSSKRRGLFSSNASSSVASLDLGAAVDEMMKESGPRKEGREEDQSGATKTVHVFRSGRTPSYRSASSTSECPALTTKPQQSVPNISAPDPSRMPPRLLRPQPRYAPVVPRLEELAEQAGRFPQRQTRVGPANLHYWEHQPIRSEAADSGVVANSAAFSPRLYGYEEDAEHPPPSLVRSGAPFQQFSSSPSPHNAALTYRCSTMGTRADEFQQIPSSPLGNGHASPLFQYPREASWSPKQGDIPAEQSFKSMLSQTQYTSVPAKQTHISGLDLTSHPPNVSLRSGAPYYRGLSSQWQPMGPPIMDPRPSYPRAATPKHPRDEEEWSTLPPPKKRLTFRLDNNQPKFTGGFRIPLPAGRAAGSIPSSGPTPYLTPPATTQASSASAQLPPPSSTTTMKVTVWQPTPLTPDRAHHTQPERRYLPPHLRVLEQAKLETEGSRFGLGAEALVHDASQHSRGWLLARAHEQSKTTQHTLAYPTPPGAQEPEAEDWASAWTRSANRANRVE